MVENPYRATSEQPEERLSSSAANAGIGQGKAAYNVVADTVVGVNVRGSDNRFQAIFTAAAIFLLAPLGTLVAILNPSWKLPWYGGALIGGFCGMIGGVLLSGIYIMIYRGLRHLRGKHD